MHNTSDGCFGSMDRKAIQKDEYVGAFFHRDLPSRPTYLSPLFGDPMLYFSLSEGCIKSLYFPRARPKAGLTHHCSNSRVLFSSPLIRAQK